AGLLGREGDPYPVLRLTAAAAAVLKGHDDCVLYRAIEPDRRRKRTRAAREILGGHVDAELFDRLRDVRLRIARARGLPPYVIFHDSTLRDMAERRPRTIEDLHAVYGVGAKKAADFGDAFLDAIRTHGRPD